MKFKIGDKVRIRKDLKEGDNFKLSVTDDMEELKGKIVTITEAWENDGGRYSINKDLHNYTWTEDMFEGLAIITKEELFKMPIGTKITTDLEENNIFVKVGENDFCNNDCDHIEYDNIKEDLSLDYYEGKIIEIQEPTYEIIYKEEAEVKEMTIAEIEKELGYPIKIVKEEE